MRNKRGAAKWVKISLVVLALCFFTLFCTLALGAFWIFSVTTNPSCVQSAASSFMTISDPLPNGLRYLYGFSIFNRPYVRIISSDLLTFHTFFEVVDTDLPAEQAVERIIERAREGEVPGTFGVSSRRTIAVASKGMLKVGKQNIPYVIGHVDEPVTGDKKAVNTFISAFKTPSKGRAIVLLVERQTPANITSEPLTITKVRALTDAIESFK